VIVRALLLLVVLASCNTILGVHHFDRKDGGASGDDSQGTDDSAIDSALVDATPDMMLDAFAATQQAYVKATNTRAGASFGWSVALSADGSTLAVGSTRETSNATGIGGNQADTSLMFAGAVYVYRRTGYTWALEAYVKASNTNAQDNFGWTVALSDDGNTMAVCAIGEASANGVESDNSAAFRGAAYIFVRSGTSWSQQAYLHATNSEGSDSVGEAIALSGDGNTLAVGSWREDGGNTGINSTANNNVSESGAAWVFHRSGINWTEEAYVKPTYTGTGDRFGYSLALSNNGNVLAVGSSQEGSSSTTDPSNDGASGAGAVWVYTRSGSTWSQRDYVKPMYPRQDSYFGTSVSLSSDGTTLAVGEEGNKSAATGVGGSQTDTSGGYAGAAYIFTYSTSWAQSAFIKATNTNVDDGFGIDVDLSSDGTTLLVGAYFEDGGDPGLDGNQTSNATPSSGAAYLYQRTTSWAPLHYIKASNPGSGDQMGRFNALSDDGKTLVAGVYYEDGSANTINGTANDNAGDAGAAYVYVLP